MNLHTQLEPPHHSSPYLPRRQNSHHHLHSNKSSPPPLQLNPMISSLHPVLQLLSHYHSHTQTQQMHSLCTHQERTPAHECHLLPYSNPQARTHISHCRSTRRRRNQCTCHRWLHIALFGDYPHRSVHDSNLDRRRQERREEHKRAAMAL